ncbi:hypothetical protein Tcan_01650, partial [Toxocara canis]
MLSTRILFPFTPTHNNFFHKFGPRRTECQLSPSSLSLKRHHARMPSRECYSPRCTNSRLHDVIVAFLTNEFPMKCFTESLWLIGLRSTPASPSQPSQQSLMKVNTHSYKNSHIIRSSRRVYLERAATALRFNIY